MDAQSRIAPDDALSASRITRHLRAARPGSRLGAPIEVEASLASTMDRMAELAREGAPEGALLLAEHQQAGRGRLQRRWLAPPGSALMLSILFRPATSGLSSARIGELSMALGLAALDALRPRLPEGREPCLKWPNDVLIDDLKIAGLLAEADWPASGDASRIPAGPNTVILGLGLNVHQLPSSLPPGATSLAALHAERGGPVDAALLDRNRLAADLLVAADRRYARLRAGLSLRAAWSERLDTLGREVVARRGDREIRGLAESVAEDGGLVIRRADGRRETLHAGDVTLAPAEARS